MELSALMQCLKKKNESNLGFLMYNIAKWRLLGISRLILGKDQSPSQPSDHNSQPSDLVCHLLLSHIHARPL